jgi:hypothetical protein
MPVPHGVVDPSLKVEGGASRDVVEVMDIVVFPEMEDHISSGISLSPSWSSRESGAREQAGPSDVGCELSPSSSLRRRGELAHEGAWGPRGGCGLSPSSVLGSRGALEHTGASLVRVKLVAVVVVVNPTPWQTVEVSSRVEQDVVIVSVRVRLSDATVVGSNLRLSKQDTIFLVIVVLSFSSHSGVCEGSSVVIVVVDEVPNTPQPVMVASNVAHADLKVSVCVKLIDAIVVGSKLRFLKHETKRSVTVVLSFSSHFLGGLRDGTGVGSGPVLGPPCGQSAFGQGSQPLKRGS